MSWNYRAIMSGARRDPLALLARAGLHAASIAYGMGVHVRNRRYDRGSLEILSCGVPVISVGNITTGGTGKTPIVCYLAKSLRRHGLRVAIVSRGYGRGQEDANDEALELHDRLPDVPHVQDADRVAAARLAVEELESQVILMDDGFQHRRLHRDLDIVVIDATCPFGYGYLLPRGLLREPISRLKRADLVMLSRCDLVATEELESLERSIHAIQSALPIVRCRHQPAFLLEHPDRRLPLETLAGRPVALISAIGNPAAFARSVEACGAVVVAERQLGDHDPYEPATVQSLREWITALGDRVERVICTHKDLVKLRTDRLGGKPLHALMIELTIDSDQAGLHSALAKISQLAAAHNLTD